MFHIATAGMLTATQTHDKVEKLYCNERHGATIAAAGVPTATHMTMVAEAGHVS